MHSDTWKAFSLQTRMLTLREEKEEEEEEEETHTKSKCQRYTGEP